MNKGEPWRLEKHFHHTGRKVINTLIIMPQDACTEKDMVVVNCLYVCKTDFSKTANSKKSYR